MANIVSTTFTGDPKQLFKTADEVEKRLKELGANAGNIVFGTKRNDVALQFAQRDIKQIESARIKSQKLIEDSVAKSEKAITALALREVKTRNNAELSALKQRQSIQLGKQELGQFAQQIGSNLPGVGSAIGAGGAAGAAAAAILTTVSAVKALTTELGQLGIAAVQTGAKFQQTAAAIQVFAGSSGAAQKNLKELETLARNTPGLGLETAEKGFLRLRAVGFEAKLAQDLLQGLSKVKILSGGTQEDLEAVIYNLTQVRAVGRLTGDELKESLGRLPALAPIIQRAFGTIDTKKLADLNLTSQQFFDRLNDALKDTKGAAGGFSDAWQKLTDSITLSEREFSKPILEPLTDSVKLLTGFVDENKSTFKTWGEEVANVIRGVNDLVRGVQLADGATGGAVSAALIGGFRQTAAGLLSKATFGASDVLGYGVQGLSNLGAANRDNSSTLGLASGFDPNVQKAVNKQFLDDLSKTRSDASTINERFYRIEEARIKTFAGATREAELGTLRQLGQLKEQELIKQLEVARNYGDRVAASTDLTDKEKLSELRTNSNEIGRIYQDIELNRLAVMQQVRVKEREIAEERKRKAEEYKQKVKEIRDLLSSNFAQSSQNPFVKIFSDAEASINRAREATKGFSNEIRNAAIASAQSANGGSLFGQRIDSRLQAFGLRQQAASFLGGQRIQTNNLTAFDPRTGRAMVGTPSYSLIGASNLPNDFNAEQIKQQELLKQQIALIKQTPFNDIKGLTEADRKRFVNNSIAELFKGIRPEDINADLRGQAAQSLLRQAQDTLNQESQALQFYEKMNAIVTTDGLIVTGANQNVTVNAYGGATTDTSATPTRPAQNQTRPTR
jgi:tape measure domain-containing protein